MERAVWTFWTKPGIHGGWFDLLSHTSGWVLSVNLAREHFSTLALYTDTTGWELLEPLNLPFDEVHLDYDNFDMPITWWASAKMNTLSRQKEPFVHLDTDVFLWKPLPERLKKFDVFAQSYEGATPNESAHYRIELVRQHFVNWDLPLPEEFLSYLFKPGHQHALNTGIVGGSNLDFINYYVKSALYLMSSDVYQDFWIYLRREHNYTDGQFMILLEQYFLNAICEFYESKNTFKGNNIQYGTLLKNDSLKNMDSAAEAIGYTHMISGKRDYRIVGKMVEYVQHRYKEQYETIKHQILGKSLFKGLK